MGGGRVLNRKLILYSLENVKYLNNVVDILNSSGESEGFLEVFLRPVSGGFLLRKKFR